MSKIGEVQGHNPITLFGNSSKTDETERSQAAKPPVWAANQRVDNDALSKNSIHFASRAAAYQS